MIEKTIIIALRRRGSGPFLSGPPQAENPVKQDSFIRKEENTWQVHALESIFLSPPGENPMEKDSGSSSTAARRDFLYVKQTFSDIWTGESRASLSIPPAERKGIRRRSCPASSRGRPRVRPFPFWWPIRLSARRITARLLLTIVRDMRIIPLI